MNSVDSAENKGSLFLSFYKHKNLVFAGFFVFFVAGFFAISSLQADRAEAASITSVGSGNWSATAWPNTLRTGTITSSTLNANITGSGTAFTTEISIGNIIKTTGNVAICTVQSITDDTHIVCTGSSASTNSGITYNVQGIGPGDTANIGIASGAGHLVVVDGNYTVNLLTMNNTTSTNTLTINPTFTLTVTTLTTMAGENSAITNSIVLGTGANAGNLTTGGLTINNSTAAVAAVSKVVCSSGGNGTLLITGSGAITIFGSSTASSTATAAVDMSAGLCTVTTGTAANAIVLSGGSTGASPAAIFKMGNGVLNLKGSLSFTGSTAGKDLFSMANGGILTLNSATLPAVGTAGTYVFTGASALNSVGTSSIAYATAVTTWAGLTVASGTLTLSGANETFTSISISNTAALSTTKIITDSGNLSCGSGGSATISGSAGGITLTGASATMSGGTCDVTGLTGTFQVTGTTGPNIASGATFNLNNFTLGAGVPFTINNTATLTTTAGLTLTASSTAQSITLGGSSAVLTVGTTVTHNQPTSTVTSAINVNAGTLTVGGLYTMAGSTTTASTINKLVVTTGTVNMNLGMTFVAAANANHVLDMSGGAGNFNLKNALTMPALSGTFTMGTTSTFTYADTTAQTVTMPPAGGYNLLVIKTTGGGATLGAAITTTNLTNNLTVGNGTLISQFSNGGFAIAGTSAKTFTVNNNAIFNMTGTSTYPTGFTTFTYGATSTVYYKQTGGTTITNPAGGYGHLGLMPAGATALILPSGTITIAGDLTIGNGTNAGATALANSPTINIAGSMTISISATFVSTPGVLTIGGDFNNYGTFTHSGGTVSFNTVGNTSNLYGQGTVIDSYPVSNSTNGSNASLGPTNVTQRGQSFTGTGTTLNTASFILSKGGNPTGTVSVSIFAHSGTYGTSSLATGSALATSDPVNVASLPDVNGLLTAMVTFKFTGANQIVLTNATNYVVVLVYTSGDANNYIAVNWDQTSPTHGGNETFYNGTAWFAQATNDLIFYINNTTANVATFNNFSISGSGAKAIRFADGSTTAVSGLLTLTGTAGNLVNLNSISGSAAATINFTGTSSVSYTSVTWMACTVSTPVIATTNSTNGGNNGVCWSFPSSVTISGVLRQSSDETTAYGTVTTIRYSVGGAASATVNSTITTGAYSFSTTLSAGSIVTIWLDTNNSGVQASAVLRYGASCTSNPDCSGIDLILDRVTLYAKDGLGFTSTTLAPCDADSGTGCADTDIGFLAANVAGDQLFSASGWTNNTFDELKITSGTSFTFGGSNSSSNSWDKVDVAGTLTGSGTFSSLTLTGSGTGNTTTDCTSSGQAPLCVTGTVTFGGNTAVSYTGTSGSVIYAGTYVTLNVKPGANGITHTLGAGTFTVSGALVFGDGTHTLAVVDASANNPTVTLTSGQNISISANTELKAGSGTWTLPGTVVNQLVNNGTFTANTSTFSYTSTTSATIANVAYYNLDFSPASGTPTYTLPSGPLNIGGNLSTGGAGNEIVTGTANDPTIIITGNVVIGSGDTFIAPDAASNTITVGGSWTNSGTFTHSSNTVLFNSTSTGKTITTGGSNFYKLTFNGLGGGWTLQDNFTVANVWTITNGNVNGGSVTVTLSAAGTPFVNNGTFTPATSTVSFTGTTATTIAASSYNNLSVLPGASSITDTFGAGTFNISGNLVLGDGTHTLDTVTAATNASILTVTGNFTISANTTFVANATGASNPLSIGGNWTSSGTSATFTNNGGTVIFTSTSTGKTITANGTSNDWFNITFNGTGGNWIDGAGDYFVDGLVSILAGTYKGPASGGNLYLSGGITGSGTGTFNNTGGGFVIIERPSAGNNNFGGATQWTFDNGLSLGNLAGTGTITNTGTGAINVINGKMTLNNSVTFNAGSANYIITQSGQTTSKPFDIQAGSTFTPQTSTVTYTGATATDVTVLPYYNLAINPAGNVTDILVAGTYTVLNDLTLGGTNTVTINASTNAAVLNVTGSLVISANTTFISNASSALTIGGDFTNNGTFTHSNGTVVFAPATGTSHISGATNTTFYNLTDTTPSSTLYFASTKTYTISHTLTLTGTNGGPVAVKSSSGSQVNITVSGTNSLSYISLEGIACSGISLTNNAQYIDINNNTGCFTLTIYRGGGGPNHSADGGSSGGSGGSSGGSNGGGGGTSDGGGSGGASSAATATATVSSGVIVSFTITSGGGGYTSVPLVTITDSGGTGIGATGTAVLGSGAVVSITVNSGGTGYVGGTTIVVIAGPGSSGGGGGGISD